MANMVQFKKGLLANLPTNYTPGCFYVTTDERSMYLDISNTERIRLGDFQEFGTLAELEANSNPSTSALYYVTDMNVLAKWDGSKYVQINLDTGATSIEVVGDGNAVTNASYNATTRKITLTKGATYATPEGVDSKISTAVGTLGNDKDGNAYANVKAYVDAKTSGIATDAALSELTGRVTTAENEIDALQEKVGGKAVGTQIDEKIAALKLSETYEPIGKGAEEAGKVSSALESYKTTNDAAVSAAKKSGDDAMAEAQKKVASVTAGDASVTVGGTATAPTVAAKLSQDADNALTLASDGLKVVIPAAAEYSIVKAEDSGDYAAVYNLTKDGAIVGASINIPKDMVVKSGSVVGDEIILVLNDKNSTEIKIPVGSLIEYVTSGSQTGDMVVVNVSDDHKVTAVITDGTITLAKLHSDIQTAIGKAHSHANADVLNGITAQNITDWNDAVSKEHEHTNKEELDKIASGDVAKWNSAQANAEATAAGALASAKSELEGKISAAQSAAEKVANDNNTAMDTRMKAVEGTSHTHSNKVELDKIVEGDKAKWDAAEQNAKNYADTALQTALTWGEF